MKKTNMLNLTPAPHRQSINTNSSCLDNLCRESLLENCLIYYGLTGHRLYLRNLLVHFIPSFSQLHQSLLKCYFDGDVSINRVCQQFITHFKGNNYKINKNQLYSCLADYANAVDNQIKTILAKRSYKKKLRFLGFGLGDGLYARKLISYLVELQLTDYVELYSFDPCSNKELPPFIKNLSEVELQSFIKNNITFDVVLARWVLHHIHAEYRWHDLSLALNNCCSQADIIIVEESGMLHQQATKAYAYRLKELLLGLTDIIINIALNPAWLENYDMSFYLKYLRQEDMQTIEDLFHKAYTKSTYTVDHPFFNQWIFHYQLA